MSDLISRQQVLKTLRKLFKESNYKREYFNAIDAVEDVPSAETEKGRLPLKLIRISGMIVPVVCNDEDAHIYALVERKEKRIKEISGGDGMSDFIDRQAMLERIEKTRQDAYMMDDIHRGTLLLFGMDWLEEAVMKQPSIQPEPLTDKEQRIFLAAMGREEEVCKQVDAECMDYREPYEGSLVRICHEIVRRVKGVLWT